MYGRMEDPITLLMVALLFAFMLGGTALYLGLNGKLIIEKPYLQEYTQAQTQLEQCVASKTPSCAPCQCNPGATGLIWGIAGMIMMVAGSGFAAWRSRQLDKREEALNKRKGTRKKK